MVVPCFVVLSSSSRSNALGRALTLAHIASRLGQTEVWAYDDGGHWAGSAQWDVPVVRFRRASTAVERIRQLSAQGEVVVWSSKSFAPLDEVVNAATRIRGVMTIADFDDDDAGLIDEHRALSLRNRVLLHPLRRTGRQRVVRAQRRATRAADAITVASSAVSVRLGLEGGSVVRVVHARIQHPDCPRERTETLRVGFLGTIRAHKGIDHLIALVRHTTDIRAVTYHQAGWAVPEDIAPRWTELPPDTSLVDAYRAVDVVIVPSDSSSASAQVQLPAKVIDASAARIPLLATPTPALREVLEDGFVAVTDWAPEKVEPLLRDSRALDEAVARSSLIFAERLSLDAAARTLATLIGQPPG